MNTIASAPFYYDSKSSTRASKSQSRLNNPGVQVVGVAAGTIGIMAAFSATLFLIHALISLA